MPARPGDGPAAGIRAQRAGPWPEAEAVEHHRLKEIELLLQRQVDGVQGGYTAVQELLRHGHRRIGFLNNVDDIPATHGRLAGYRQALAEAGVVFDPGLVVTDTSDAAGGYRAARGLLQAAERPTALFCFTDRMAMGAYHAAAQLGLSIPADLSVIGFDNQELICDGMFPGLTTVALPHYEMRARAVVQLLSLTGARDRGTGSVAQEMLPCPLVARASVASPPRL
ncbi:substrate-binding domain-containing protein [Streptomyces shaanxiensis]|uniref:Transcriptional regulator LacI/GalR-like sensor domain-containing protein n=1 Tax=Streptomyces shaanxiensis TaxID=653357 RepID=A0ABP7UCQ1_9ACTN